MDVIFEHFKTFLVYFLLKFIDVNAILNQQFVNIIFKSHLYSPRGFQANNA